jgi:hypothetical protein
MELTNQEKIDIVTQHIKNSSIKKYNVHVAILSEEAATQIDQTRIDSLNEQLTSEEAKYAALVNELNSLQPSDG